MQNDKQLDNEVVRNADCEVFLTNSAPGYLEYAGTAQGRHVTIDAERGDIERCHRMEVRQTRSGFEIHKASFERAVDWTEWRETLRESQSVHQNRQEAVELVKSAEDNRVELAAEFRAAIVASQLDRELLQEGSSEPRLKPRGFIGKDILATTENENTQMNDALLVSRYYSQQERIEQLESWIQEAITRPSMSRELRLEGLELVEARSPDIRLAVERICPSRSQGLGQTLEIER
jgi:hypothetical protein